MREIETRRLRDGHTVQLVPVDEIRVGDRIRFGGSNRGTYYSVESIDDKPKTRAITVRIGDYAGTHTIRPRRDTVIAITPRLLYEAQLVHDDGESSIYIDDSTVFTNADDARIWLQEQMKAQPSRPLYGRISPGEMTGAEDDRYFEQDFDADEEYVPRDVSSPMADPRYPR